MTKSELEERIQQALREKREGARFYNPYSLVSVETQTNTYFITQPTMIVRAPETSSLSKLVAETREQMRKEQQASKMPLKYVGGNVGYVSDWSLPTPSDVEALYYDSATLGDASISFAARITFARTTGQVSRYHSTSAEILDIRPQVEDLKEYGEAQGIAHDIRAAMDPTNIQWVQRSSAEEHPMALPTSE